MYSQEISLLNDLDFAIILTLTVKWSQGSWTQCLTMLQMCLGATSVQNAVSTDVNYFLSRNENNIFRKYYCIAERLYFVNDLHL